MKPCPVGEEWTCELQARGETLVNLEMVRTKLVRYMQCAFRWKYPSQALEPIAQPVLGMRISNKLIIENAQNNI